ncbi:MAG: TonB-dependent receptor plug domain-containing protein [Candidatus Competibacter sp.]
MVLLAALSGGEMAVSRAAAPDLTQLGIEELMNVQVVSASKQAQRLADAASAVFVITQDDIRRSGATSVPEALRLAPGVQVARIDGSKWAISDPGLQRALRQQAAGAGGRAVDLRADRSRACTGKSRICCWRTSSGSR